MRRTGLLLVIALAACGGGASQPVPPVAEVVDRAATAMASVETASFSIERTGAPLQVAGLDFESASGVYLAPDRSRAVLEVRAGDVTARLGTIAIDDRVWLTDPITGDWSSIPPEDGFNAASVFEAWPTILRDDLGGAAVRREGGALVLTGTVAGERIATLTAGVAEPQVSEAVVRLDPDTHRIRTIEFSTEGPDGTSSWTIRLERYGEPVTVEPPS
ncbi:MAG: hypothetical protein R3290_11855 [Acidimicrobiia bacterium]|nr:hypothetical protein [Acidimicrobiia bacterium]